ncbi:MAG TPA: LysM peptidoglycan-binding domain-containing protein [Agromyces sp.]
MTAIAVTAPTFRTTAPTLRSPRTRLRLTLRGRRVLALLAALPAVIALSAVVISGGAAIATRDAGAVAGTFTTVTVGVGDTLWSIAEEVAPQADPRDVVDAIVRLNALDGATLLVGDQVALPLEYAPSAEK